MAGQTYFITVRDKDFMNEGELIALVAQTEDLASLLRQLHMYCDITGRGDVFSLEPYSLPPGASEGLKRRYEGLAQLGRILRPVGSERSYGTYNDARSGLWHYLKKLPLEQQRSELAAIEEQARNERVSLDMKGVIDDQTV